MNYIHGLTANPPLNDDIYSHSVASDPPETVASNPSRLQVDRYHTPVSVHVYMRNRLRHVKWFTDLQEGYQFARGLVEQYRWEDAHQLYPWIFHPFEYSASRLEYIWNSTGDGMILGECEHTTSRIEIFYEPDEANNIHHILEEQRRVG
jgi:hypothetical protein